MIIIAPAYDDSRAKIALCSDPLDAMNTDIVMLYSLPKRYCHVENVTQTSLFVFAN